MDPRALDTYKGPKFRAAHSGTVVEETGHLAALLMKECSTSFSKGKVVPGRKTQPVVITIAELGHVPASGMPLAPTRTYTTAFLFDTVPLTVGVGACALCAFRKDWYATSSILLGIVGDVISFLLALGSGDFVLVYPEPAKESSAGDGILGSDKDIVLLRGTKGAVNAITHGMMTGRPASEIHIILARCLLFCFIKNITLLLLNARASWFGTFMFSASYGVSSLYNPFSSPSDREKINRKILFERVLKNSRLIKYTLGTRTTAVVFMLLVLRPQDPTELLNELVPENTKVWKQWKAMVLKQLRHPSDQTFLFESPVGDFDGHGFTWEELDLLELQEQNPLELLHEDAQAAYNGYRDYLRVDSL